MATTAQDIINRALRSLSVIGEGETASAAQYADGLISLNDLVESWANEPQMIYQIAQDIIPLTPGKAAYTIGIGAYDVNTTRPVEIEQAFCRWNNVDYPVAIKNREAYEAIISKSLGTNLPEILYYDTGFPASTIRLWAVPNMAGVSLYVDSLKPFAGFATIADTVVFPPGYARALRLNLAVELMPEFQVNNPRLDKMALDAKNGIKRANHLPENVRFDSAIPSGRKGRYNIFSDL